MSARPDDSYSNVTGALALAEIQAGRVLRLATAFDQIQRTDEGTILTSSTNPGARIIISGYCSVLGTDYVLPDP